MLRASATMQRLAPCRPMAQLATLPKPALRRTAPHGTTPPPTTAPKLPSAPQPLPSHPAAAPHAHSTTPEHLQHGLACCCPALLLQLSVPVGAQAAKMSLDVPDWLSDFSLVDFLLNTPVLTLGLLVLLLRFLPRLIKAFVRYLLLPATVVLLGWLAISHPQQTASSIQMALEFARDHPVASSFAMLGLAALLLGPQLVTGGLLLGGLLLLAAKTGVMQLPSLPSLPSLPGLGGSAPDTLAGQVLMKRAQQLTSGAFDSTSGSSSSGRGSGTSAASPGRGADNRKAVTSSSGRGSNAAGDASADKQRLPWQQPFQQGAEGLVRGAQGFTGRAKALLEQERPESFTQGAKDLGSKAQSLLPQQQAEGLARNVKEFGGKAQALLEQQQAEGLGRGVKELGGRAQVLVEQQRSGLLGRLKGLSPGVAGGADGAAGAAAVGGGGIGRGEEALGNSRVLDDVLRNS